MKLNEKEKEILLGNLNTLKPYVKSTKKLTEIMGINESTYFRWCQGNRAPTITSLINLAEELKINVADLFTKKLVIETCLKFVEYDSGVIERDFI